MSETKYQYACDVFKRATKRVIEAMEKDEALLKLGNVFEDIIHQDQLKGGK